jgi:hypothetical protein
MSSESGTESNVTAFWDRHAAYVHARDHGWGPTPVEVDTAVMPPPYVEVDVDDLIGAKGEKQTPTDDEVRHFGPDPTDPGYISPNGNLVNNADSEEFPFDMDIGWFAPAVQDDGPEQLRKITESLLGRLAARKAAEAVMPLQYAVDALREPLRTVAINCLYLDVDSAKAARAFGTSVETIEFLTELALDQLAAHLTLTWNTAPRPLSGEDLGTLSPATSDDLD